MKRKLNPPEFQEDLRTFPKQPLWMRNIESHKGESISTRTITNFTMLTLIILCLIIILASSLV